MVSHLEISVSPSKDGKYQRISSATYIPYTEEKNSCIYALCEKEFIELWRDVYSKSVHGRAWFRVYAYADGHGYNFIRAFTATIEDCVKHVTTEYGEERYEVMLYGIQKECL